MGQYSHVDNTQQLTTYRVDHQSECMCQTSAVAHHVLTEHCNGLVSQGHFCLLGAVECRHNLQALQQITFTLRDMSSSRWSLLETDAFWDVRSCRWESRCWHFLKDHSALFLRIKQSEFFYLYCLTLKMKALCSFVVLANSLVVTQHHIAEALVFNIHTAHPVVSEYP